MLQVSVLQVLVLPLPDELKFKQHDLVKANPCRRKPTVLPFQSKELFLVIKQNSYLKPMCFFSFQKHKQAVPVKIIQDETPMALEDEIKLLDKTVVQKELSTSLSTETEDEELKMLRKAAPPTVRQEQEEVSIGLSSCKQDRLTVSLENRIDRNIPILFFSG